MAAKSRTADMQHTKLPEVFSETLARHFRMSTPDFVEDPFKK